MKIWRWKIVTLYSMFAIVDQKSLEKMNKKKYFSDVEWKEYQGKRADKRADWMAGRIAAKIVLRNFFQHNCFTSIPFHEIKIRSNKLQKPFCQVKKVPSEKINAYIDLSIAHTGGIGIAALSRKKEDGYVGVDIEKIRMFEEDFLESFLTEKELIRVKNASESSRNLAATLLWSIKESYVKACGQGLLIHPRSVAVAVCEGAKNRFALHHEGRCVSSTIQWFVFNNAYVVSRIFISSQYGNPGKNNARSVWGDFR